jgi:predicted nucleotidyltransferase
MKGVYDINEIKRRLTPVFQSAPVYRAILFGSYSTGKATPDSDVDIVIDSQGELLDIRFCGVLEDISERLSKRIDLIEISEIRKDSPIFSEIMNHGVLLYEKQG